MVRMPGVMRRRALRAKWLQELEVMLKGTKTPMGAALENRHGDRNLLGGGRRASTLRARVRASRKFFAWLAVSADVAFPSEVAHLTGYLESRHTEPCNRGSAQSGAPVHGVPRRLSLELSHDECPLHSCLQRTPRHGAARPHAETSTPVPSRSVGVVRRTGGFRKCDRFTSGSTRGGCSCSVGEHSGSRTIEDSTRERVLK